jgi:putative ABC transport system permease protein
MEPLWQDLRYASRTLLKRPLFTLLVIATLALGIGANTAIFSIVYAVVLKPLPFKEPDRIVSLGETNSGWSTTLASSHAFVSWQERGTVFERMAAAVWWDANLESGPEPQHITLISVTGDYFSVVGVEPILGRIFRPEEMARGGPKSVIISYPVWQRLGADRDVLGRPLRMGGDSFVVVGVMPPVDGVGLSIGWGDVWVPSQMDFQTVKTKPSGWRGFRVMARLKPDVTIPQARAEMELIEGQLARELPNIYSGYTVMARPLHEFIVGDVRPVLLVLLGAVGFVLLIACANVINLLLARAASREKEIAIRLALGATRRRLIRQLLTESLLLSLLGAAAGLGLAWLGVRSLITFDPGNIPRIEQTAIDGRVLAFTLALSIVTSVLFGLAPALGATKVDLDRTLKEGGRGAGGSGQRERNLLIIAETAFALLLLIGSGLSLKSLWKLAQVDAGMKTEQVLTLDLTLPSSRYREPQQRVAFFHQLLGRLEALPGVEAAGANRYFPLRDRQYSQPVFVEERPVPGGQEPVVHYGGITSGYFRALGIPLLRGRDFTEQEMWETSGVVIINESLAKRIFPNEDPLGKRLKHAAQWQTVIGIVGDVRQRRLNEEAYPQLYVPYADFKHTTMTLAIRTKANPATLVPAVQREIQTLDPALPIFNVMTLDGFIGRTIAGWRLSAWLLGLFAGLALSLAAVGIYGVLSYSTEQRTREIGLRMALGAQRSDVLRLIVGQGLKAVAVGIAIGLVAALALSRVMKSFLFGVTATDPLTFASVALLLIVVALTASYLPARRAAKADPMIALGRE